MIQKSNEAFLSKLDADSRTGAINSRGRFQTSPCSNSRGRFQTSPCSNSRGRFQTCPCSNSRGRFQTCPFVSKFNADSRTGFGALAPNHQSFPRFFDKALGTPSRNLPMSTRSSWLAQPALRASWHSQKRRWHPWHSQRIHRHHKA